MIKYLPALTLALAIVLQLAAVQGVPHVRANSRRDLNLANFGAQRHELFYYVSNDFTLTLINKLNTISLTSIKDASKHDFLDLFDESSAGVDLSAATDASGKKLTSSFRLLHHDLAGGYVLIGSREYLFNVSLNHLREDKSKRIHWPTSTLGKLRGQSDPSCGPSCENYVRVAIPMSLSDGEQLIVCGTNSGQAACRRLKLEKAHEPFQLKNEFQKPALIQMTKLTSNNLVTSQQLPAFKHGDAVYFFNYGSFTQEPNIFKQQLAMDAPDESSSMPFQFAELVKTPRGSLKNPNFRSSFAYSDKVYFFYSETESFDENNGVSFKTPYSLVGEVCADDMGRPSFSDEAHRFITFKKALIYCYLPDYKDGFHIKYSEIQAVSKPITSPESEVVYAIFTYRRANTIDSALCQYQMPSIETTMKGFYKSMELAGDSVVYKKPLDSCNAYKELKESALNEYYKEMNKHYKFQIEQSISERAMFALSNVKFTALAVDEPSSNNNFNTVLFIGTADGRVLKLLTRPVQHDSKTYTQPILVQEYQMFDKSQAVLSIIVQNNSDGWSLVAMTGEQIKSIRLDASCPVYASCAQCVGAQDPYCGWSLDQQKCVSAAKQSVASGRFLQDALIGSTGKCGGGQTEQETRDDAGQTLELNAVDGDDERLGLDIIEASSDDDTYNESRGGNEVLDLNGDDEAAASPSLKYYSSKHKYSMLNGKSGRSGAADQASYMSSANFILIVCLTSVATCVVSIFLTWLFIKKRYTMANYVSKHLLHSSSSSSNGNQTASNRSSSSSASSTSSSSYPKKVTASIIDPSACKCTSSAASCHSTDDFMIKKFFSKIKTGKAKPTGCQTSEYEREKHVNVYEEPAHNSLATTTTTCLIGGSKRHQSGSSSRSSQPHSPTASSSNATSSSLTGSHSPPISTSNATATTQMHNDTLSSSSGAMEDTEGYYTSNCDLSAAASHDAVAPLAKTSSGGQPLGFLKRNYKSLSSSWFSKSAKPGAAGKDSESGAVTQNLLTTVKPSEIV